MTMVQVPIFLRELGADISQVGLFFTISMIFPLILRIIGGWLSDTIGRLRAILYGSLAGVAAYFFYTLASTWHVALLGPAFLSIASALFYPSYRAYIADTIDKEAVGRVFGIAETIRHTAWVIGPLFGGILAQNLGYKWMFAAATMSYGVAALIFLFMTRSHHLHTTTLTERPNLTSLWQSLRGISVLIVSGGLVTWLLITDSVYDISSRLSFDLMPVYLSDIAGFDKQQVGFLDMIFGIALVAASPLGGWLSDKTSERLSIVLGTGLLIVSRLTFAIVYTFWGFAFSWILLGLGGALVSPALNSLVAKGVPAHLRGITYAFLVTSVSLLALPFPWIGSLIWNAIDPKAPFLITVVLGSLALIPAWLKLKVPDMPPPTSEEPVITM
jgi:DHA1 family multidrug resistance protein-like MFS transporter